MTIVKHRSKKKSLFKEKPLRDPGESLRNHLDDVLRDKVLLWIIMAVCFIIWAGLEWLCYFMQVGRSPIIFSFCAGIITVIAFVKIRKAWTEIQQLKLGIEGERFVGQFLDSLQADGYKAIHDIVEDGYNIDHVLIGPTGIYSIETKARSKPTDHDAQIIYDGKRVLIDGLEPDRDPIKQAEAGANRVRDIIQERTGQEGTGSSCSVVSWLVHSSELQ